MSDDKRLMAPERLDELRSKRFRDNGLTARLLDHIDALAAENAELRARAGRAERDRRGWLDAHQKLVGDCLRELPEREERANYDGPETLPFCIRALAERAGQTERERRYAARWKAFARHLHAQRAFHRTMQKWAAESIHDHEAKLVALRAAASVMVAANPTAEGARELAALVLGGEER
jgi:hypothetical protein